MSLPSDSEEVLELLQPYIHSEQEYGSDQDLILSIDKIDLVDEHPKSFQLQKSSIIYPERHTQYGFTERKARENAALIAYLFTLRLDGETRLNLVKSRESASTRERPKNVLVALLKDKQLREDVRESISDAIGLYFSLDLTNPSTIFVKLSREKPEEIHEIQWGEEAVQYHNGTQSVTSYGDGIKSFVGLILATAIPDDKIILVDEPEAFLHPPLANKLGVHLSNLAERQNLAMFFATHSP